MAGIRRHRFDSTKRIELRFRGLLTEVGLVTFTGVRRCFRSRLYRPILATNVSGRSQMFAPVTVKGGAHLKRGLSQYDLSRGHGTSPL